MKKLLIASVCCFTFWGVAYSVSQPQALGTATVGASPLYYPPTNFTAVTGSTIAACNLGYVTWTSTASGVLVMNGLPTLATATVTYGGGTSIQDGTICTIGSTMSVATSTLYKIQDDATLAGTKLKLPPTAVPGIASTTEVISSSRPVQFMYNASLGLWLQISPNNGTF